MPPAACSLFIARSISRLLFGALCISLATSLCVSGDCSCVVAWCKIFEAGAVERVRKGGMNPAGKRQQEEEQNEATRQPE